MSLECGSEETKKKDDDTAKDYLGPTAVCVVEGTGGDVTGREKEKEKKTDKTEKKNAKERMDERRKEGQGE